ncbi:MAG: PRC-barrel domain-containing protein [Candidatus Woesearchaeota archaeon]
MRVYNMEDSEKKYSKQLIGKTVVSKSGRTFGEVGDLIFETNSGELIHIVLDNPTANAKKLELEKTKQGDALIPFSAVIAMGDYLVVAEEDII